MTDKIPFAWSGLSTVVLHLAWQAAIAAIVIGVTVVAAKIVRRVVIGFASRHGAVRREVLRILASLAYFVILVAGVATALGTIGVDVAALVAGAGLTGLAVGLALKDPIGNAVAGLMMLYFEPFRVGDRITVLGVDGVVDDIDLRYTKVLTTATTVLVPNTMLLTSTIVIASPVPQPAPQTIAASTLADGKRA